MAEKREDMSRELSTLQERAALLETEVNRLESDRGIEEEIRDRYEVSKKGEQVVVILSDDAKGGRSASTTSTTPPARAPSFWHKWLW